MRIRSAIDFVKRLLQRGPAASAGPPAAAAEAAAEAAPAPRLLETAPLVMRRPSSGGASPLRMAHAQSVGCVREHNEDVLLTMTSTFEGDERIPSLGLYIVADGMGGHNLGERASAVAARRVAREVARRIYLSLLSDGEEADDRPPLQDLLLEALTAANQAVAQAVGEGGTTGTAALVFNDQVIVGHVGDSRAYVIGPNGLEQLTRDHSLVQRLHELGQLSAAEAAVHPQRNVLYRAIGQGDGLEIDLHTRRLTPGSKLLLCSDGLWGAVTDIQILDAIRTAPTLQSACDKLVDLANQAGGHDNITVILVEFSP